MAGDTPSLDPDGFQLNLSYPGQPGGQLPCKRCCGCFRHVYDHFDGTKPWPCYWREHNWVDSSFDIPDKDKSAWSVSDSHLHLESAAGSGTPQIRSDSLTFKLRPMLPPWTMELAAKVSVPTYAEAGVTGGAPTDCHCMFLIAANTGPGLRLEKVRSSPFYKSWRLTLQNHGALSPSCAGLAQTEDVFDETDIVVYMRHSLNSNHEVTVDFKIDGVRPVLLTQNDGLGRPYIDTLPFTVEMTTPAQYNRWLSPRNYRAKIEPIFGPASIDYLEARITPGIL